MPLNLPFEAKEPERLRWKSAPEIEELENLLIGTQAQVIACLKLQAEVRRKAHFRNEERVVGELVARVLAAALDGHDHASSASDQPGVAELAPQNIFKNLDTGVVIQLSELESMYEGEPLSAFDLAIKSSRAHRGPARPPMAPRVGSVESLSSSRGSATELTFAAALRKSEPAPTPRLGRRERRRAVNEQMMEPLMCGPLLKRGKKLGQWKQRWYTLSVDGELTCHRQKGDVDRKAPLFSTLLAQAKVSVLPPERLEQELAESGVFGFVLEFADGMQNHAVRVASLATPPQRLRPAPPLLLPSRPTH